MANSPNKITKSTSLADLLATAVSDGTYSDVLETAKVDAAGQEAAATDIPQFGGQLIANLWDDATKRVVQMYDRSTKVWLVADATERDALGSDDDLAANDLAFQLDTLGLNYCVSVDGGAASTWAGTFSLAQVLAFGNVTDGTDMLVTDGDAIRGQDGTASAGATVAIRGGTGDGASQLGGAVNVTGGTGSATGDGGNVSVSGGSGGGISGDGGVASLVGGSAAAGNSAGGDAVVTAGAPSGSGAPGDVSISAANAVSGNTLGGGVTVTAGEGSGNAGGGAVALVGGGAGPAASGDGGAVTVTGGDGGSSGNGGFVQLLGGAGGTASGSGGTAAITGGAATAATAQGGGIEITAGAGGSGAATGGSVTIYSGDGGGTSGNSGGITIAAGAVTSGTRGSITIDAGTINLSADTNIVVTSQGYHSVRGSTARGSTNTLIYRWTSVVGNVGSDITYTDSATAGGSWAINRAGVYAVSVSIDVGHNGYIAIKKAAAVSNTFDATDIMVASEAATGITQTMSWTGYCAAGDDIWIATNTATNPTGTPVNNNRVTITRVR